MNYDYDLVVIGGGSSGLTSAGLSASLGAKTALIEAKKLGGDCTWYGCVPSKSLLKASKVAHTFKTAEKYGIKNHQPEINFRNVISRVHSIQNYIYNEADKPEIYEKMGVDVFNARAIFIDSNSIEIKPDDTSAKKITSKYFIIAAGGSPIVPPIEDIDQINFHTNETIFSIEKLPEKLLILGAGPIGTEMAQAFVRFGSEVIVIDKSDGILQHDDKQLSILLKNILEEEGIKYKLGYEVKKFEKSESPDGIIAHISSANGDEKIECDSVLISAGRKPNIDNLNLEACGVKANKSGIIIDKHCRTNINNIFAVGDCACLYGRQAGTFQFTHYAEHMAKKAVSTALLKIPFSTEPDNITWSTYTEPELAHVGLTEKQLKERNVSYKVYKFPFGKIDRAATESMTEGLIKVYAKEFSGKIYGVDILGAAAGEMISEFALAIRNNISLRKFSDTIHPYPTYLLGNRRAADQWYIQKQSLFMIKLLQKLFGYRGKLPDLSNKERII